MAKLVADIPTAVGAGLEGEDVVRLEITEVDGAFFLFRLNAEGDCVGDTWHLSIDAAKAQAHSQFGVADSVWREVP